MQAQPSTPIEMQAAAPYYKSELMVVNGWRRPDAVSSGACGHASRRRLRAAATVVWWRTPGGWRRSWIVGPTCQWVEIGMQQGCFGPYGRFIRVHRPDSGPMHPKDV